VRTEDLLINGERVATEATADVRNPYSGDIVGRVAQATADHAARAVQAAHAAHLAGAPPQHERAAVLERARDLVRERREDLARCIAEEAGKPITTARAEADRCADTLLYAAIEARTLAGQVVPFAGTSNGAGKSGFTLLHPKGVVAAITPFNFPLNLVCHKLAPAFAAGCPVVLKPAGDTPLTAYLFAALLREAGVPDGFLHVLTGPSSEIGPVMTERDEVQVISFTGSTEVGRALAERNPHKTVLLELGSNSPVIVDETADVEHAAARLAATAYAFAGQSCISAQRVYVHQQVKDAFTTALVSRVAALRVGDPLDDTTDVGPMIRPDDRDRVVDWIAEATRAGAKVRHGGEVGDDGILQPTVLDDVTPDMKVSCEEVFGPVLAVQPVADLGEAIRLSNDSRYGLHAAIFTSDYGAALRAARELRFGGVVVNESPTYRADQQPYGGVRDSGNTREGPAWAVHDYLEETVVILHHG
jgi:acyl-CoA reductase-like NAD-dependent aldehyde dehydrogenase